jgi:hypothetical protein
MIGVLHALFFPHLVPHIYPHGDPCFALHLKKKKKSKIKYANGIRFIFKFIPCQPQIYHYLGPYFFPPAHRNP